MRAQLPLPPGSARTVFPAAASDPAMPAARAAVEAGRHVGRLAWPGQVRLPGDPEGPIHLVFAHRRAGRVGPALAACAEAVANLARKSASAG
jgi:hypothetical protein